VAGVTAAPATAEKPASLSLASKTEPYTRDWARAQYIDAARIVDYYDQHQDENPEFKKKLARARMNLETARNNALKWRIENYKEANKGKKGGLDVSKEAELFENHSLGKWREEARENYALEQEPYTPPPAEAAPATGGAIPTEATPESNPNLREPTPDEMADIQDAVKRGKPVPELIAKLIAAGISPKSLQGG
jgi:hypothetical protein